MNPRKGHWLAFSWLVMVITKADTEIFSDAGWISLGGLPGTDGVVHASVVGQDGHLYIGGDFKIVRNVFANHVAKWDGQKWSALGLGMNDEVHALAAAGTNIYAGGLFTAAGGMEANHVARWDGSRWWPLGEGTDGDVLALLVAEDFLYLGGSFNYAGNEPARNLARWNGNSWSNLGLGPDINGSVRALELMDDQLYAGGSFSKVGNVDAIGIVRWDGQTWSALGGGFSRAGGLQVGVFALYALGTNLYAGGNFTAAGGVPATNIAQWNGSAWSGMGAGLDSRVRALDEWNSQLVAAGDFDQSGYTNLWGIGKWDGQSWLTVGSNGLELGQGWSLASDGTNLFAGGSFTSGILKWDGSWSLPEAPALGPPDDALAMTSHGGEAYVGTRSGFLVKWSNARNSWVVVQKFSGSVRALASSGTNLYAAGSFFAPFRGIAKWNGVSWSSMGVMGTILAVAASGNDVYAGGNFTGADGVDARYIAKWDGNGWSAMGSGMDDDVEAILVVGTNVYAGGTFTNAGGIAANHIAKWDGISWSSLGTGVGYRHTDSVQAMAVIGSDLYVGGRFTLAGNVRDDAIFKWDGSSWSKLGSGVDGEVEDLLAHGNELYVAGSFDKVGGISRPNIPLAVWDREKWSFPFTRFDSYASSVTVAGGEMYLAGSFIEVGDQVSAYAAKIRLSPHQLAFSGRASATNGALQGLLTGPVGLNVVFDMSLNLPIWLPVITNALPTNGLYYSFEFDTNQLRFFRARVLHPNPN